MATFRATIKGNRGEASRLGHSEINADVNGWNIGARVHAWREPTGRIVIKVVATGGSNGGSFGDDLLGFITTDGKGGRKIIKEYSELNELLADEIIQARAKKDL